MGVIFCFLQDLVQPLEVALYFFCLGKEPLLVMYLFIVKEIWVQKDLALSILGVV